MEHKKGEIMATITKINMNGILIEEKDGHIYINGKHIDTGKPHKMDYTMAISFGIFLGVSGFAVLLTIIECIQG